MTTIYTDTDEIRPALDLTQGARQMLAAGDTPAVIDGVLAKAAVILGDLIERAEAAQTERTRRETEYQQTGRITFSSAAA